jgi:NAD(P) transhydrogenase subunit alpha
MSAVLGGTDVNDLLTNSLFIFVLAAFLGFEVIRRVPKLLHTPLMSFTNALSAIALVGSVVLAGSDRGTLATVLGTIAVTASTINAVGGFLITDRMLRMFRRRDDRRRDEPKPDGQQPRPAAEQKP